MHPSNRSALWKALLAGMAFLWLLWVFLPSSHPVFVVLVAVWLIGAAWLSVR